MVLLDIEDGTPSSVGTTNAPAWNMFENHLENAHGFGVGICVDLREPFTKYKQSTLPLFVLDERVHVLGALEAR